MRPCRASIVSTAAVTAITSTTSKAAVSTLRPQVVPQRTGCLVELCRIAAVKDETVAHRSQPGSLARSQADALARTGDEGDALATDRTVQASWLGSGRRGEGQSVTAPGSSNGK